MEKIRLYFLEMIAAAAWLPSVILKAFNQEEICEKYKITGKEYDTVELNESKSKFKIFLKYVKTCPLGQAIDMYTEEERVAVADPELLQFAVDIGIKNPIINSVGLALRDEYGDWYLIKKIS